MANIKNSKFTKVLCLMLSILMLVSLVPVSMTASAAAVTKLISYATVHYDNSTVDSVTGTRTNTTYTLTITPVAGNSIAGITVAQKNDSGSLIALLPYTVSGNTYSFNVHANNTEVDVLIATNTASAEQIDVRWMADGKLAGFERIAKGTAPTAVAVDPIKNGNAFAGWSYNGNIYKKGDTLPTLSADATFTATWTPLVYDLTYYRGAEADASVYKCYLTLADGTVIELFNNDGTDKPTYLAGAYPAASLVTLGSAELEGYTFEGWRDEKGYIHPAGAEYEINADTVLTAVWTDKDEDVLRNTVKFYAEDGSLYEIFTVVKGEKILAPVYTAGAKDATYRWENATLKKWYDEGDEILVDGDYAFYATELTRTTYSVTAHSEPNLPNVVTSPTATFKSGEPVTIDIVVPAGYILKSVAADTAVVDNLRAVGTDTYTYTLIMPEGNVDVLVTLEEIPVGKSVVKFVSEGDLYDYVLVAKGTNGLAPAAAPTRKGYTFAGWQNGNVTVGAGDAFAVDAAAADEIVYTALWTADSYNVNYDANGGIPQPLATAHGYEDVITLAAAPVKDGFTFIGWTEASTGFVYAAGAGYTVKGDVLFTATYEEIPPAEYIVSFVDKDTNQIFGYMIVKDGDTVVAPAGPSFAGKTFKYWTDGVNNVLAGATTPVITAPTTFYAEYDVNTHDVTSITENCTVTPAVQTNVAVGTEVKFTVTPAAKNAVDSVTIAYIDGLALKTVELTEVNGEYAFFMPDADVTVTAKAVQNEFAIFTDPETYAELAVMNGNTALVGDTVVFTASTTNPDYSIANVFAATASGKPIPLSTDIQNGVVYYAFAMPAEDVTVTAQVAQDEYTVTFLDDDNTLLGIVAVGSGDLATAPVASKAGYTFDKWVILPDGTVYDPAADAITADLVVKATYVGLAQTLTAGKKDNLYAMNAQTTVSSGNLNSSDLFQSDLIGETGKTVYFTVAAAEGYVITDLAVVSAAGTNLVVEPTLREKTVIDGLDHYTYSFTMPAENVALDVYTAPLMFENVVTENIPEGGSFTINGFDTSNLLVATDDTVTVEITPADGYTVDSVVATYIDILGNPATVNGTLTGNTFTYTMVPADVTVEITYVADEYEVNIKDSNFLTYKPDASKNPAAVVESLDADLTSMGLIEIIGGSTENYTNAAGQIYAIPANGNVNVGTRIGFTVKTFTGYALTGVYVTYDNGEKSCVITEKNGAYYFDMPADDVTVTATFTELSFDVTKDGACEANGKVTVNGRVENINTFDYKTPVEIVVTPDAGYYVTDIHYVLADGTVKDFDAASYTGTALTDVLDTAHSVSFHMPASDVTVYASYAKIDYTLSAVYNAAEVDVTYPAKANVGDLVSFQTAAKHGYFVEKVYVVDNATGKHLNVFTDAISAEEIYGANYSFEMPASAVTIHVLTVKDEYTVKYFDEGGLVEYETVDYKDTANVSAMIAAVRNAKPGYHFIGWYSDDVETPVLKTSPSVNDADFVVVKSTIVRAVYAKDAVDVVFGATSNGTVTVNGNKAAYTLPATFGDTVTFTVTPDVGYVVDEVSVTSVNAEGYNLDIRYTEKDGTYSFIIPATYKQDILTAKASDVLVNVTFKKDTFILNVPAETGEHGTVAVNGKISTETTYSYLYNDAVSVAVTPDAGYYVISIRADGASNGYSVGGTKPATDTLVGPTVTLNLNMPAEDLNLSVNYGKIDYSIDVATTNAANAAYGTVAKSKNTATLGDTVTLTVTEKTGYDLVDLTVTTKDGIKIIDLDELVRNGNVITTSFEMPAEPVVVTATYTTEKYEVIKTDGCESHGTVVAVDANGVLNHEQTYLYDFGDAVNFKVEADAGWYIASAKATAAKAGTLASFTGDETAKTTVLSFTMPAEDVELSVTYMRIAYDITPVFDITQGTVVTTPAGEGRVGDLVDVAVTPAYGYLIDTVDVKGASGEHIALSKDAAGKYHFTMPAEDVTVTATFIKDTYTVVFKDWNGDMLKSEEVDYLDAATAPADPERKGYTFIGWDVKFDSITADTTVTALYEIITSNIDTHSISFTGVKHGKVSVTGGKTAKYGDTVYIVADPDDGWRYDTISVKTKDGKFVPVSFVKTDKYYVTTLSFEMPDTDVTVTVSFKEHAAGQFTDTRTDDWYYTAVEFVTDRGYFVGVSETLFAPKMKMTRAMFVAVLARMDGVNLAGYKGTDFVDVDAKAYYAPAVKWASENGIVKGVSKTEFAPEQNVTREEMAAIMYRYAKYAGLDTSIKNDAFMDRYIDLDEISPYALYAVRWAVGTGLIKGVSKNEIAPKEYATRAQVAQIIKNLCDKVVYE